MAANNGERMPVLFIGHGSPMNAIEDNDYTRSLTGLGRIIPRPDAILVVSAHWLTKGTSVCCLQIPETIHDFYGFPRPLYQVQYPAPGAPAQAKMLSELSPDQVKCDLTWGLDHASWAVLKHVFPNADVPVFELSLDYFPGTFDERPVRYHYDLAKRLAAIREQGVLVMGSGNAVHNLRMIDFNHLDAAPYEWAKAFDDKLKEHLISGDDDHLIDYRTMPGGDLAVPTLDHYLPMIYAIGMRQPGESLEFVHEGFQNKSISMRSFIIR
ncbi:MAG TPA: 4,5-DOPA dioxygenase extradiol [Methanomassiliicoccales archaeon]|jgi:4,5-DOPA dioxygenase extradiol